MEVEMCAREGITNFADSPENEHRCFAKRSFFFRRRRSDSRTKALILRVFHALLPLPHALLPRPLMISTRNFRQGSGIVNAYIRDCFFVV